MKGTALAGGRGTRLPDNEGSQTTAPDIRQTDGSTLAVGALLLAGIREILITPGRRRTFRASGGAGRRLGLRRMLSSMLSSFARRVGAGFPDRREKVHRATIRYVLSATISSHGSGFTGMSGRPCATVEEKGCATIFGYRVEDPERYGVVESSSPGHRSRSRRNPHNPIELRRSRPVSSEQQVGIAKSIEPS